MGVAPAKIIFMVILSFEVALVSSPNVVIVTKKVNKYKEGNFVILQSIGFVAIKSCETRSSTPADIPVNIFLIPNHSVH